MRRATRKERRSNDARPTHGQRTDTEGCRAEGKSREEAIPQFLRCRSRPPHRVREGERDTPKQARCTEAKILPVLRSPLGVVDFPARAWHGTESPSAACDRNHLDVPRSHFHASKLRFPAFHILTQATSTSLSSSTHFKRSNGLSGSRVLRFPKAPRIANALSRADR